MLTVSSGFAIGGLGSVCPAGGFASFSLMCFPLIPDFAYFGSKDFHSRDYPDCYDQAPYANTPRAGGDCANSPEDNSENPNGTHEGG